MSDDERHPREAAQNSERTEVGAPVEEFKAFVGGISWHMDDKELRDTFRKYDPLDARVMLDRITNRSRGFGFVHFKTKEDLEDSIQNMHDTEVDGRKISVTRAIPQDSIQPGTPAAALMRRGDRPPERSRFERYERYPPPRAYERYAPRDPPRSYERVPYEHRYPEYERSSYDRYASYGYEREYARDPYARADPYDRYGYADPYERDPYYVTYSRVRDPYESRGGFPDRYEPERRYERYARAGGPDREYGRYAPSSRAAPYERGGFGGRPI